MAYQLDNLLTIYQPLGIKAFVHNFLTPSADSRITGCQLLAKEWAISTGKMPPGGLLKNRVVK